MQISCDKSVSPQGPVHTYPDSFESATFLSGFGFSPPVSGESSVRISNFLSTPSRVEISEYAVNPESAYSFIQ